MKLPFRSGAAAVACALGLGACGDGGHTDSSTRGVDQSERSEKPIALDDPNSAETPNVNPPPTPGRTDADRPQQQPAAPR